LVLHQQGDKVSLFRFDHDPWLLSLQDGGRVVVVVKIKRDKNALSGFGASVFIICPQKLSSFAPRIPACADLPAEALAQAGAALAYVSACLRITHRQTNGQVGAGRNAVCGFCLYS